MARLFAALELAPCTVSTLSALRRDLPGVDWSSPEDFHITLRYFGTVDGQLAAKLDEGLRAIVLPPFHVEIHGVGSFQVEPKAWIIWAGIIPDRRMRMLNERCESLARSLGLLPDLREWAPHVTLGHLKADDPMALRAWLDANRTFSAPSFATDRFQLFRRRGDKGDQAFERLREYRFG